MPVDEPLIVPHLKSRTQMREHIQAMRGLYSSPVIVMFDVMRGVNIVPVIEEMHTIQSHCPH
jgi:hypothetical protein